MTKTKVRPFDVAEHLDSPETIAAYLNEAFRTGDMAFMPSAIRDVARARGSAGRTDRSRRVTCYPSPEKTNWGARVVAQEENIRFALGVIDDNRRLIAAAKAYRWDIVKWTVTLNVALAGASIALHQKDVEASGLFFLFAVGVAALAALLISEVNRRMTATRNDGVAPEQYLLAHSIDVKGITGKEPIKEFGPAYDKEELRFYVAIVFASALPALIVWLLSLFAAPATAAARFTAGS
jgi:hypothetical protein